MVVEKNAKDLENSKPGKLFGIRHIQCILLATAIVADVGMRHVLNVAVIAMVGNNPPYENILTYPEWAAKKNVMLSAFFWGYMVFQVLAGEIAKKYGPKLFLGVTMIINSMFCVLLPYFGAWFGYGGVIACRFIQGLTQGPLLPSCHNLLSKWIPVQERAKLGNLVYAGSPFGVLIAMPAAGAISSSSLGWPACFYLFGGIGIVWSTIWLIFGSDSPLSDRFISEEEKKYIQAGTFVDEEKTFPTPWKAMFTSVPFYAILISHCGQSWGYYTLLTETPSYMEKVLGLNLTSGSILSAIPYFFQWAMSNILSPIADILVARNIFSVGVTRKLCNSIGTLIPSASLCALVFVDKSQQTVILIILIVGVGMNAGIFSGFYINHMDIAPVHAGTLMALTNSISNIFSISAPLSVDLFVQISGYRESEKQLWNIVFIISGIVYAVIGILYILLGSGEEQPWNKIEDRKISESRKIEPLKKMSLIAQVL